MTSEIGTEAWLAKTGGRLTVGQSVVLSAQGLAQSVSNQLRRPRVSPGDASGQRARVTTARNELLRVLTSQRLRVIQRQGEPLLNHGCRTFLIGAALLSDQEFSAVNLTAAAVASLAHDDGLVHPSAPGNCFTADSAEEVSRMMAGIGAPDESISIARSAVVAHFQPRLPRTSGPDERIVALGASADVMGFGLARVDRELQHELWQEWPELGFLNDVKTFLKGERTRAPLTRPGVLSWSGMPYLLRSER